MSRPTDTPKEISILQLYPRDMNIYGDQGNLLVLKKRLEQYGYTPVVTHYNVGDDLPHDAPDIILGGGGQDSGQTVIQADLLVFGDSLRAWADDGVPMLVVCGLYQLFGRFFKTLSGTKLDGIGVFDAETHGSNERLIGNVLTASSEFGEIIGYENHSGQTFLGPDAAALSTVLKGAGNNASDGHEGARYKNVIGTYLHGPLLPKNPRIADFLIETAIERRFGSSIQHPLTDFDDTYLKQARKIAAARPR